ncbi:uncharacterized protein STEHIDRAFT_163781 [Stereum hirsutum FP-91666 SS1]|uniref:Uncharacterized protein n=1 Tax=Stereum hirsutum (strain FP-91666) TaxID=721885 RepID=R7RX82_STEHR|nr:uncharacterized protein STEHIDRAFT_163781 [Stereum hirsutum FP-91666 SS1]EIM79428.1 hypothetical protein STEHIDRAFT_163781 [Stereum hirsutum FP-91666 SS1]
MSTPSISDGVILFWKNFVEVADSSPNFLANEESVATTGRRELVSRCVNKYRGENVMMVKTTSDLGSVTEAEFKPSMVLKVGDYQDGTRLGAMGNVDRQIDDKTSVKFVIAGKGFDAVIDGGDASDFYQDQLCGLHTVQRKFAGSKDTLDDWIAGNEFLVRPFVKDRVGSATPCSAIGGKYANYPCPAVSTLVYFADKAKGFIAASTQSEPALERSARKRKNPDIVNTDRDVAPPVDASSTPTEVPAVALGAKYPTNVLPDHDCNALIRHSPAVRVNQLDWRGLDNELIPMWDIKNVLRPGSVVMVQVVFKMWDIKANETNKKASKSFQIVINKLRLMHESDAPPAEDPATVPDDTSTNIAAAHEEVADEFDLIMINNGHASSSASSSEQQGNAMAMDELPAGVAMETDGDSKRRKKGKK